MGICDNKNEPQKESTQPINNLNNDNGLIKDEVQTVIHKEIQPIIFEEIQPVITKEIQPIIHKIILPVYQIRKKEYNTKENSIILDYPLDNINLHYIQNIDQQYIEKCFKIGEQDFPKQLLFPQEPQQQNQDSGEIPNFPSQPYPQNEGTSFDRVQPNIKSVEQPVAPRYIQPIIQKEIKQLKRTVVQPIIQRDIKIIISRKIEVIFQNQL